METVAQLKSKLEPHAAPGFLQDSLVVACF
eukprot:SAG11_NODE_27684_length_330_cov_0.744589_1_plen_29_part_10